MPLLLDFVLVVVQQFLLVEAVLPRLRLPQRMQVLHVRAVLFVVLLEVQSLLPERLDHRVDLDEQLVASLDLLEKRARERVADVQQMRVSQGQQLLHGVVVALPRQKQPEVHHLDRAECHGELSLDINNTNSRGSNKQGNARRPQIKENPLWDYSFREDDDDGSLMIGMYYIKTSWSRNHKLRHLLNSGASTIRELLAFRSSIDLASLEAHYTPYFDSIL